MRKYRIITNGKVFRIEHRWFWMWFLSFWFHPGIDQHFPREFKTLEEAKDWIKRQTGKHPDDQWSVVRTSPKKEGSE